MLSKLKNAYLRGFYFFGQRIQKILSPEELYSHLSKYPVEVKKHELASLSSYIRKVNDTKYYDSLLKLFLPKWDIKILKSKFIGNGIGGGSLNVFREVETESGRYFEKVYFTSQKEWKTIRWFQNHMYQILNQTKITAPKICKSYPAELLTVVYFEWFTLNQLEIADVESTLIEVSLALYETSLNEDMKEIIESAPSEFKDYKNHFVYKRNIAKVNQLLLKQGVSIDKIESQVAKSKLVLSHGDIQSTNVFKGKVVVDWDSFGFYPIGLDPAFLYYRLLVSDDKKPDAIAWVERNYKSKISTNDWEEFQTNFIYFLYIFANTLFRKNRSQQIEKQLISFLTKHYK